MGGGQQKVTVEYVNVESGGQAVVGNVEAGEPARRRKAAAKSRAIIDNPGEVFEMPSDPDDTNVQETQSVKASTRPKRGRRS